MQPVSQTSQQEEAYPGTIAPFETISVNGNAVSAMRIEDQYVMEGDMLIPLSEAEARPGSRTEAVGVVGQRWPEGIVYYKIAAAMPQINRSRIQDALNYWRQETNVRFVERTNEPNYVLFQPGSGCAAHVGMVGGQQIISLSTECGFGNTVHEIGHCVGLFHEHTRLDRDKHLRIKFENVLEGYEGNFTRVDTRTDDAKDWSGWIDLNSIMMYFPTAFSKNGEPTIVRKDGNGYSTQRNNMTLTDIKAVNRMYP